MDCFHSNLLVGQIVVEAGRSMHWYLGMNSKSPLTIEVFNSIVTELSQVHFKVEAKPKKKYADENQ